MSNPKRRELPHERENRKVTEILYKMMDLLGADSPHNLLQKVTSLHSNFEAEKEKYSTLVETLCVETETANIGRVFDRLKKWKRQNLGQTIAEQFGLDLSFLLKFSTEWKMAIEIDDENWEEKKLAWDKKRGRWQSSCEKMCLSYLEVVNETCEEEGLPEDETRRYMSLARDQLCEDYQNLPYKEFFQKYDEDVDVALKITRRSDVVEFSDCLVFIKEFAPRQLFKELSASSSLLGEVSKTQFDKWDENFAKYSQEPAKTGLPKLRSLMRKITGGMVYRLLREESGWPAPLEENKLEMLLSTPEENPASADWEVNDGTTLLQFAKHFEQLAGAGK